MTLSRKQGRTVGEAKYCSLQRGQETGLSMNHLDLVMDPLWRSGRRPSCPWPSPSTVPRHPAQAPNPGRDSEGSPLLCIPFELGVWEKGSVSRAPSVQKGKGPTNHMDKGCSLYWVPMGRHRWHLGSALSSWMTYRWRAVLRSVESTACQGDGDQLGGSARAEGTEPSGRWKK